MRTTLLAFICLAFGLLAGGCNGSKSMAKKAAKLNDAGLYREAADLYITALERKSTNIDAKIGLKGAGQQVLNDYGAKFYQAHQGDNHKDAVYNYLEAKAFVNRTSRFVELTMPPYYAQYYETSKDKYLEEEYNRASDLLDAEEFKDAESTLREINSIDPKYKDVADLLDYSTIEPMYRAGITAFESQKYREAYYKLKEVVHRKGHYKEAFEKRDEALEKATVTVAMLPAEGQRKFPSEEDAISGKIVTNLINSGNPFIKVVDRQHIQRILEEQHLGLSGVVGENAAQAGELFGAKLLFTGRVLNVSSTGGQLKTKNKKGYRAFTETRKNSVTGEDEKVTKYAKVRYQEVKGETKVLCTYQFQLVSTETGEVILSDVLQGNALDQVRYGKFEGDSRALYSGTWKFSDKSSTMDKVNLDRSAKREIDQLFRGQVRNLRGRDDLKIDVINDLGQQVGGKINGYNPES